MRADDIVANLYYQQFAAIYNNRQVMSGPAPTTSTGKVSSPHVVVASRPSSTTQQLARLPDESDQDMHRRVILAVIDKLRERKARPDVERISSMVARVHGMRRDNVLRVLEALVDEGTVLKVEYKGSVSYRNASKWKRGSLINSVLNSEDTSRKLLEAVKLLCAERPNQQGFTVKDIMGKIKTLTGSDDSQEDDEDSGSSNGSNSNKVGMERALDREAATGGLMKLSSDCYCLDLDGSRRQAVMLKRKKSSSLSSATSSPSQSKQNKPATTTTTAGKSDQTVAKKPRHSVQLTTSPAGSQEPLDLRVNTTPVTPVKATQQPAFRPISCAPFVPNSSETAVVVTTPSPTKSTDIAPQQPAAVTINYSSIRPISNTKIAIRRGPLPTPQVTASPPSKPVSVVVPQSSKQQSSEVNNENKPKSETKVNTTNKKHSPSGKTKSSKKDESVEPEPAVCDFCLAGSDANRMGVPEDLLKCKDCCHQAHPSCMLYSVELASRARQSPWQCSECKTCCTCQDAGDAEMMLICDACDKGYHVSCHRPPVSEKPLADAKWICSACGGGTSSIISTASTSCNRRDGPVFEEEENRFDASRWSIQRVQGWLIEEGFPTAAQAFKEQEIDGASLLLMKRMDVLTGVGLKLGPAVKVYERISKLQNRCRTLLQAN